MYKGRKFINDVFRSFFQTEEILRGDFHALRVAWICWNARPRDLRIHFEQSSSSESRKWNFERNSKSHAGCQTRLSWNTDYYRVAGGGDGANAVLRGHEEGPLRGTDATNARLQILRYLEPCRTPLSNPQCHPMELRRHVLLWFSRKHGIRQFPTEKFEHLFAS